MDEAKLISESLTNPNAFRPLYKQYAPRIYRMIAARVGHQAEAEDLTADTFLGSG